MKNIVLLVAVLSIASCSYMDCFKQVQVLVPQVEAVYNDYENQRWTQLMSDAQLLVPSVQALMTVCHREQLMKFVPVNSSWGKCIEDVSSLVEEALSLKGHLDAYEYARLLSELPAFLKQLKSLNTDCHPQKLTLLGEEKNGPLDCLKDIKTLIDDADRIVEEYQNGEYDFQSLVSELQQVYLDLQKAQAECKSATYIPNPQFIRASLKKGFTSPQTCFADLAQLKVSITTSLQTLENGNFDQIENIVSNLSQSVQEFTQHCIQKTKLLQATRISTDFKKCFSQSYTLMMDLKKFNDDYQAQETEFEALIQELSTILKEVDPVLIVCDSPVEEKWNSYLPDSCVENLSTTALQVNQAMVDHNAGKEIQTVKDLQKVLAQYNKTKATCPFLH